MSGPWAVPGRLREAIARDLRPVRLLRRPWQRALALFPVAVLLLWLVPQPFGIRHDAGALGLEGLWGLTLVEVALGLLVIAIALREAVPGRSLSSRVHVGVVLVASSFALATTLLTWHISPVTVPAHRTFLFWRICFTRPILYGLPVLLMAWMLALRALPLRPVVVGLLSGLGAGLLVDASWRLTCAVSQPSHVMASHLAAVVVLTCAGAVLGHFRERFN